MFVTFEGCEGVGKSTQLALLKDYLKKTGQEAVYVREPGSTEISEKIRSIILDPENTAMTAQTEALLYAAARAQLVAEVIRPALDAGKTVICDRYVDSSAAYQGYARGLGVGFVAEINSYALENAVPDVTVFIDLRPSASFRSVSRDDRLEREEESFHDKVYEGYIAQSKASNGRFVMIKPEKDKFDTHRKILAALRERGAVK
ncbi:MAG TPA: dTMP kinase [Candidatus Limadaptatus stercorigallinarum]|uniref:Thymidylate kinase n=1 Tax=Candidatus Limadaptatus stercorigallinarum TaxID=2840845 RepID=A0A9D1L164_9FIRM|nr:dTMP kinase [Candidatus Limadaptatus stercorigallinarum]